MFNIRVVAEGPTDVEVLQAILDTYIPGDYRLTTLQPDMSLFGGEAGDHGGGWKGVRSWCASAAASGGLESVGALTADVNLLVVHVDADIAHDGEIDVARPCPPPEETIQLLESKVLSWLQLNELPERVALWIPSMATEAWILRAFFSDAAESTPCTGLNAGAICVECVGDPARQLLNRKPKFVHLKPNKKKNKTELKKKRVEYKNQRSAIAVRWNDLVETCWSAKRLHDRLKVYF